MTVNSRLEDIIKSALWRSFGDAFKERDAFLSVSKLSIGDYQSTVALAINKELKLPPKEIANKIVENLSGGNILKSVDISGPGYINLYLSEEFISSELLKKLQDNSGRLAIAKVPQPEKVVIDFSSPNIAKEMHVVRSSILFFYFTHTKKQIFFSFICQFNRVTFVPPLLGIVCPESMNSSATMSSASIIWVTGELSLGCSSLISRVCPWPGRTSPIIPWSSPCPLYPNWRDSIRKPKSSLMQM
jgi:hypothetical protein